MRNKCPVCSLALPPPFVSHLRILTLSDTVIASDWIHWACAMTMGVRRKTVKKTNKKMKQEFCKAAYSQFGCYLTVRADDHMLPNDTVRKAILFFKCGLNIYKTHFTGFEILLLQQCSWKQP